MATFTVKVMKNSKTVDAKGRPFRRVSDKETGQFYTLYSRKDLGLPMPEVGELVDVSATLHPLGDGIKLIAFAIEPAS